MSLITAVRQFGPLALRKLYNIIESACYEAEWACNVTAIFEKCYVVAFQVAEKQSCKNTRQTDRQTMYCTCNVTLKGVRTTIVAVEKQ